MLSCKQVVDRADHLLAGEMPWRQRLGVIVHLGICHHCRRYLRQLRILLAALPHLRPRTTDQQVEAVLAHVRAASKENRGDSPA